MKKQTTMKLILSAIKEDIIENKRDPSASYSFDEDEWFESLTENLGFIKTMANSMLSRQLDTLVDRAIELGAVMTHNALREARDAKSK